MDRLESLKRDLEKNRKMLRQTFSEYHENILRRAIASQERAIAKIERG